MTQEKQTLGQAIDQILTALEPLEESARKTALLAVCSHLNIELPSKAIAVQPGGAKPAAAGTMEAPAVSSSPSSVSRIDIRSLKESKKPTSAQQMACLVAYYLKELAPDAERRDSIAASELEKYFKQAGFKLPKHLPQLLSDAKAAGYFDSAARGQYKLNAVGHNLVAHSMPSASPGT